MKFALIAAFFQIAIFSTNLPAQCTSYTEFSHVNANYLLVNGHDWQNPICDMDDFSQGWFRFTGAGNEMIPTWAPGPSGPQVHRCRASVMGWQSYANPKVLGQTVSGKMCFRYSTYSCAKYYGGQTTNCGTYYVYYLIPTQCGHRYCTAPLTIRNS